MHVLCLYSRGIREPSNQSEPSWGGLLDLIKGAALLILLSYLLLSCGLTLRSRTVDSCDCTSKVQSLWRMNQPNLRSARLNCKADWKVAEHFVVSKIRLAENESRSSLRTRTTSPQKKFGAKLPFRRNSRRTPVKPKKTTSLRNSITNLNGLQLKNWALFLLISTLF